MAIDNTNSSGSRHMIPMISVKMTEKELPTGWINKKKLNTSSVMSRCKISSKCWWDEMKSLYKDLFVEKVKVGGILHTEGLLRLKNTEKSWANKT